MIDNLHHVGLILAAGIIGTSIALVWALESIVGIWMIVAAIAERLGR